MVRGGRTCSTARRSRALSAPFRSVSRALASLRPMPVNSPSASSASSGAIVPAAAAMLQPPPPPTPGGVATPSQSGRGGRVAVTV